MKIDWFFDVWLFVFGVKIFLEGYVVSGLVFSLFV